MSKRTMAETPTLTDAQLDEIEAREKTATLGDWGWNYSPYNRMMRIYSYRDNETIAEIPERSENPKAIADFIAHSRTDIPALIAALRESRERESAYAFALKRIARFENRHGPSDEAQIARAALGEQEAPHA